MLGISCKGKMSDLEPIIRYKMNDMEAKAYKIALIWQEECRKEIPNEQYVRIRKNTDPRKSNLFKYCYKLAREIKGILNDEDIIFYVRAQIQILKSIKEGEIHALIEPHCLVGDKAWRRWKLWKYKFSKTIGQLPTSEDAGVSASSSKIINDLKKDLEFINKNKINSLANFRKHKEDIRRWFNIGELSFYYAILSPWMKKIFSEEDLEFDRIYYRSCLNPKIENFFKENFVYEFENNNS